MSHCLVGTLAGLFLVFSMGYKGTAAITRGIKIKWSKCPAKQAAAQNLKNEGTWQKKRSEKIVCGGVKWHFPRVNFSSRD
jgi:hypothetical protein